MNWRGLSTADKVKSLALLVPGFGCFIASLWVAFTGGAY